METRDRSVTVSRLLEPPYWGPVCLLSGPPRATHLQVRPPVLGDRPSLQYFAVTLRTTVGPIDSGGLLAPCLYT